MFLKRIGLKSMLFIFVLFITGIILVYLWRTNNITSQTFLINQAGVIVLITLNILEAQKNFEDEKTKLLNEAKKLLKSSQLMAAEQRFLKVIALDEKNHAALIGLGGSLKSRSRWKEALGYFRKAIEVKKTSQAYFGAGVCYLKEGDYKMAIDALKKSLEQEKPINEAYLFLGDIYFMLGEDFDAKKYYVKYLLSTPEKENLDSPVQKKLDKVIRRIETRQDREDGILSRVCI
jgi:tetratricopeptide (TPR) repeat protein